MAFDLWILGSQKTRPMPCSSPPFSDATGSIEGEAGGADSKRPGATFCATLLVLLIIPGFNDGTGKPSSSSSHFLMMERDSKETNGDTLPDTVDTAWELPGPLAKLAKL